VATSPFLLRVLYNYIEGLCNSDLHTHTSQDWGPPLLQARVVLRIDWLVALVIVPVGAGVEEFRIRCRDIDLGFALQKLDTQSHRDMKSDVAVHLLILASQAQQKAKVLTY
jgi:hypothetical protein